MRTGLDAVRKRLYGLDIRLNEPLCAHTSFRIGGPADIFFQPASRAELLLGITACRDEGTPYFIMGQGTNLLVRGGGIRGLTIQLGDCLAAYRFDGVRLMAQAGARMALLARAALEKGLSGLEFAGGIPGTLGGGAAMNAGAYGGELKQVLRRVAGLNAQGEWVERAVRPEDMGYRFSLFRAPEFILVEAELSLQPDNGAAKARQREYLERRRAKQPLEFPSAGSVFKRPPNDFAGRLIERAGLKGYCVGGAAVSEKHAGFIVNLGGASAEDVLKLMAHVTERVLETSGTLLEPELKIVGEEV